MISLSDAELSVIMNLARPLNSEDRNEFLLEVAAQLAAHPELGIGLVSRVARDVQRRFFAAPTISRPLHRSRYEMMWRIVGYREPRSLTASSAPAPARA